MKRYYLGVARILLLTTQGFRLFVLLELLLIVLGMLSLIVLLFLTFSFIHLLIFMYPLYTIVYKKSSFFFNKFQYFLIKKSRNFPFYFYFYFISRSQSLLLFHPQTYNRLYQKSFCFYFF